MICTSRCGGSGPLPSRCRTPGQAALPARPTGALRARRTDTAGPPGARHLGDPQEPGEAGRAALEKDVAARARWPARRSRPAHGMRPEGRASFRARVRAGQFFVPHQDSEKDDAMVGSLVVTLPSSFKGGALVVEHGGEVATYRSSKQSLSFVAFYSDCRHQVRPVTSGCRIVLTYNLILQVETASAPVTDGQTVDAVARCLDEHFTAPLPPPRWGTDVPGDPPSRLVYLLDHEYTARGVSWARLKGSDATRLRCCARRQPAPTATLSWRSPTSTRRGAASSPSGGGPGTAGAGMAAGTTTMMATTIGRERATRPTTMSSASWSTRASPSAPGSTRRAITPSPS